MLHYFVALSLTLFWGFTCRMMKWKQEIDIHVYCKDNLMGIDGFVYAIRKFFRFNRHFRLRNLIIYIEPELFKNKPVYMKCLRKRFYNVAVLRVGNNIRHYPVATSWIFVKKEGQSYYDLYLEIIDKVRSVNMQQKKSVC